MVDKINVIIRKRGGVIFEGLAYAVSSTNEIGPFDILFNHSNFVAKIRDKIIIHLDKMTKKEFIIDSGIISAKENFVEVFVGI